MIRKGWLILSLFTLIISCTKNGSYYTISGKVLNNPTRKLYIYEAPVGSPMPVLKDSLNLKNDGSFSYTTPATEESLLYLTAGAGQGSFAAVITDSKNITINADLSKQGNIVFTGSKASQQGLDFMKKFFVYLQNIYNWDHDNDSLMNNSKIPDSIHTRMQKARKKLSHDTKLFVTDFVTSATSPMLKIYAISNYQTFVTNTDMSGFALEGFEPAELEDIINKASALYPDHKGLAAYKKTVHDGANRIAPEFTLTDVNDKPVSLSSLRGKFVLIDFWASWCGPCRMENPNVVKAYNRFKDKNFTIIGVSLDKPGEKDNWLKAIKDDGLTWTQVSDLKYWNSVVVPMYGITGIPYNVLIDPTGKIIGESLRGEALEDKLAAVLK